ncbi:hypothetical protein R3P38DRAFT_2800038 [Favolaschia claudopus]|uniref:Uncharacterized protein n=1 Tax=Favolaschia claudopus TaxID=2862362 RepID=A0AAV9ZZ84_9AGAR
MNPTISLTFNTHETTAAANIAEADLMKASPSSKLLDLMADTYYIEATTSIRGVVERRRFFRAETTTVTETRTRKQPGGGTRRQGPTKRAAAVTFERDKSCGDALLCSARRGEVCGTNGGSGNSGVRWEETRAPGKRQGAGGGVGGVQLDSVRACKERVPRTKGRGIERRLWEEMRHAAEWKGREGRIDGGSGNGGATQRSMGSPRQSGRASGRLARRWSWCRCMRTGRGKGEVDEIDSEGVEQPMRGDKGRRERNGYKECSAGVHQRRGAVLGALQTEGRAEYAEPVAGD